MNKVYTFIIVAAIFCACKSKEDKMKELLKSGTDIEKTHPVVGSEEFNKMIGCFNAAIELDTAYINGDLCLGRVYYNLGAEKMHEMDSIAYRSLFSKSEVYNIPFSVFLETMSVKELRGNPQLNEWFSMALKHYKKAYPSDSMNISILTPLKNIYLYLGDTIMFDKFNMELYKNMIAADSLNFEANYNSGIKFYNKAVISMMGRQKNPMDTPAFSDAEVSQLAIAKNYFQRAYKRDSTHKNNIMGLAGCYWAVGDTTDYNKMERRLNLLGAQ